MAQDDSHPTPLAASGGQPTQPQPIVIQQRPTAFGRWGNWLFAGLVCVVVVAMTAYGSYQSYYTPQDPPREKYHSLAKNALKKIAIIDISGVILDGEDSFAKKQIDQVREDQDVVAVVARIDSPGGTVTGSNYIYHHLRELVDERKLPLVVSMGSLCASGGYYIAMAVGDRQDAVFAEPTTWTGSIGVIIPHFDFSTAMNMVFIKDDSITSGPLKQMGSPTKRMTTEERKLLQALVDDSFQGFKQVIMSGRPKFAADQPALDAVATGQIFTANQALEHGLVDKIGFVEAAIARAAELANVQPDDVRCIKYEQPPTLLGELVSVAAPAPARGQFDLASLLDRLTPRAYYLWSSIPTTISNSR
jgi:protease-4